MRFRRKNDSVSESKEDPVFDIALRCVEYGSAADPERFRNYGSWTVAIEETYKAIKHNGRTKDLMDWISGSEDTFRSMSDREYRENLGFTRDYPKRLIADLKTNMAIIGCR